LLTALIPLISWKFFKILGVPLENELLVAFFTCFAFLLNISREIMKDLQDMEGDQLVNVRSVPLILGVKRAKMFIALSSAGTLLLYLGLLAYPLSKNSAIFFTPVSAAVVLSVLVTLLGFWNVRPSVLSLLLKVSILTGIISLFAL
jgi:4-hydroxybenzoate polyprenyltransferase